MRTYLLFLFTFAFATVSNTALGQGAIRESDIGIGGSDKAHPSEDQRLSATDDVTFNTIVTGIAANPTTYSLDLGTNTGFKGIGAGSEDFGYYRDGTLIWSALSGSGFSASNISTTSITFGNGASISFDDQADLPPIRSALGLGTIATADSGMDTDEVPLLVEALVSGDWLRMTSNGIEGLNNTETLSALGIGSNPANYDDTTANFTGNLQEDGVDVALLTDVQGAFATPNMFPAIQGYSTGDEVWFEDQADFDTGTSDFSIWFWVWMNGFESDGVIIDRIPASGGGFAVLHDGDGIDFVIGNTGSSYRANNIVDNLDYGKWHSIVITVDRDGDITAYVDDTAQTPQDISATSSTNITSSERLYMFDSPNYGVLNDSWLGGSVGFSTGLLTQTEIEDLAKSPISYKSFNDVRFAANLSGPSYSIYDEIHPDSTVNYEGKLSYTGTVPLNPPTPTLDSATTLNYNIGGRTFFCDTSSSGFTVTLPDGIEEGTPLQGTAVTFVNTGSNTLTIDGNGSDSIQDKTTSASTYTVTTEGGAVTLSLYDEPASSTDVWYVTHSN